MSSDNNYESDKLAILSNYKKYNPNSTILHLAKNTKKLWYSNLVVAPALIIVFAKSMHLGMDNLETILTISSTFILFYNLLIFTSLKYAKFTMHHYSQGQWVRKNIEQVSLELLANLDTEEYFNAIDPEDTLYTKNYTRSKANIAIKGRYNKLNYAIMEFYHVMVVRSAKSTSSNESYSTLLIAEGISVPCNFRLQSINKINKIRFINKHRFSTVSDELNNKYFIERPVEEKSEIALKDFFSNALISAILEASSNEYNQIFFLDGNLYLYTRNILDEGGLERALNDLSSIARECTI